LRELGEVIRDEMRAAAKGVRAAGSTHVASAVNVGGERHSTSVYSDGEVTVVTRDGQTEVIPHRDEEAGGEPVPDSK
jgi:hypothetical protein